MLVRSDGHPAYNFAVVVDDALMQITHVVRGEDHISNTPRQVLLYEALKFEPPVFAHLALVLGPDHTPLSKRHGATSVSEFRSRGYLPEALVNYLALLGWSPGGGDEVLPAPELARRFALEDVGHSAAVFDVEKLAWVNRHYLRAADPARLAALALPHFQAAGFVRRDTARGARVPGGRRAAGERLGRSDRADGFAARVPLRLRPGAGVRARGGAGGAGRGRRARRDCRAGAELAAAPRLDRERSARPPGG